MRDRCPYVGKAISEVLDLDVEPGLVVAGEELSVRVRIESTCFDEDVLENCLVAAEHTGIVTRDDRRVTKVIEAEKCIPQMLQYPDWWFGIPAWQNFSRR